MEADLQALAGPSAGPGGNQIFIDGFHRRPASTERINPRDPDQLEPVLGGVRQTRLWTYSDFHEARLRQISRTGLLQHQRWRLELAQPVPQYNPPFRTQLFGGNVSGPLGKKRASSSMSSAAISTITASSRRRTDGRFSSHSPYQNFFSTPQRRTTVSPRLTISSTRIIRFSFRYSYLENEDI